MAPAWTAVSSGTRADAPSLEAFFSFGFRPFFLAASVYAAAAMAIWLVWIVQSSAIGAPLGWLPVSTSPFAWHAHEMLFGFAMAAVAGFLLTAVPNWTGALPISGLPLLLLFCVWIAGRVVMALSGLLAPAIVAAVDLAFVPLLGAYVARQLFVKPAARNLVFLIILGAILAANCAYHLGASGVVILDPHGALRFMLLLIVLLVAIIGGRIIPAFTHNWQHLREPMGLMPRRIGWLDAISVVTIALFAVLEVGGASDLVTGTIALLAGISNGARLALWRGWTTARAPIVWVLHLGYAWIVIGLVLAAFSNLTGLVPSSAASHAFGTGAAGTMIMAVMSRASLGHTGRPLVAPAPVVVAYALITLAALLRVAGPLFSPTLYAAVLGASGLAWIAAFATFAVIYAPILTTPRVHSRALSPSSPNS